MWCFLLLLLLLLRPRGCSRLLPRSSPGRRPPRRAAVSRGPRCCRHGASRRPRHVVRARRAAGRAAAALAQVARVAHVPLPARGQPRVGARQPPAARPAQPAAHQEDQDVLGDGSCLRRPHLQGRLQAVLALPGPRLHHPREWHRGHFCSRLRHRGRVRASGGRRGDVQSVPHPAQEPEAAGRGGGAHQPGAPREARDVVRPDHRLLGGRAGRRGERGAGAAGAAPRHVGACGRCLLYRYRFLNVCLSVPPSVPPPRHPAAPRFGRPRSTPVPRDVVRESARAACGAELHGAGMGAAESFPLPSLSLGTWVCHSAGRRVTRFRVSFCSLFLTSPPAQTGRARGRRNGHHPD